jgi:hypothetical protein
VEGFNFTFYIQTPDRALLELVLQGAEPKPRCELIAPLDCFMWDRKLIRALFGFHYAWEIYTPAVKRVYGYYTLPLLYGESLVGRVDSACDRKEKTLNVKNIWFEDGVKRTKKLLTAVQKCLDRFAAFNGCVHIKGVAENLN